MDYPGDMRRGVVGTVEPLQSRVPPGPVVYRAFHLDPDGVVEVESEGQNILVSAQNEQTAVFRFSSDASHAEIGLLDMSTKANAWKLASAAFEYLFSTLSSLQSLTLAGGAWVNLLPEFSRSGIHVRTCPSSAKPMLLADMFWQTLGLWMPSTHGHFPRHDVHDGKISHPLRSPKPKGTVYARFIPRLGGVFSLDVATIDDLPHVHRWMNDSRVNEFWHEAGDEDRHRHYLEGMFADPHIIPLIGRFDGSAFSYFEVYWAKEDIVGTFCDAGDYDRGCHVIVGEEKCRGRDWFTAWLPSLLHFMFLDDPRTERIVQEPSSNHHRQLRNLQRSGFSHIKSVDLPTKRAAIMVIGKQRFFADRLWHPAQ